MSVRRPTRDERHAIDERLRALLRQDDPAAGDALTLDEVRAMRRATLAAAEPAARRRPWLALTGPAFAAALALLAAVALWRLMPHGEWPAAQGKTDQVRKEGVAGRVAHEADDGGERAAIEAGGAGRESAGANRSRAADAGAERRRRAATALAEPAEIAAPQPPRRTQSNDDRRRAPRPAPDHVASGETILVWSDASLQTLFPTQPAFGSLGSTTAPERAATSTDIAVLNAQPSFPSQPMFSLFVESSAVPGAGPEVASASGEAVEVPGLHLQFSAPGGTRILWTLTSPSES